ncbi:MAG: acyltransferase [Candidatus Thorarchaeota archaeon]
MFQPASLKGDSPSPIDERIRKKYLILYFLIIILSFMPCSIFEYGYFVILWTENLYFLFFLLLPFNFFLLIYTLQISAILFSLLALTIVKLIFPPREGTFSRDIHDKNYLFWNLRNITKKWALFVSASNPFPWLKNRFTLRFFGVKIGKKALCDTCWISSEFIEVGANVIIGMGSSLLSFGIEQDKFFLKKIKVEENVIIGAKCVLLPGTIVKKGAKLSAHSYTTYDHILEKNLIYSGHPAKTKEV